MAEEVSRSLRMELQILIFSNHLYGIKDIEREDNEEEGGEESFASNVI